MFAIKEVNVESAGWTLGNQVRSKIMNSILNSGTEHKIVTPCDDRYVLASQKKTLSSDRALLHLLSNAKAIELNNRARSD